MPSPILSQLGTFTAPASGTPRVGQVGDHTFSASVIGTGAVSATVLIEVSNDNLAWSTLATLSMSGTNAAAAQTEQTGSHAYWRATVTAMTGTSVTVSAATEQPGDASQLTTSQKSRLVELLPQLESLVSGDWVLALADLPAATSVAPRRPWFVAALGAYFYSDGAFWRPAGGEALIAQRCGSVASPIATLTGVTAGSFALPEVPTLPAGLIAPHSRVRIEAMIRRTTAAAAAIFQARLGTTGGTADSAIYEQLTGATASVEARVMAYAAFGASANMFVATNAVAANGTNAGAFVDRSTNVNTGVAMSVSIGVANASASDNFILPYYGVWLEG